MEAFHRRFNIFPREAAYVAVVLWDAHAHLMDCFDSTARLAFLSPEPGSGKSRALEIVETVVPRALTTVNSSANALFRLVDAPEGRPTILFDEIDTVFGPKAGDNEPVRGFLNSGYRRSGKMHRCVGDGANQTVQPFSSFCAVAMAGLGSLPDTILTRSVIIRMRKRALNENVESYRQRLNEKEGFALRDRLAEWADSVKDCGAERLPTAVILERLLAMDDAPWADLDDKPLNSRGLAKFLGQYVTPGNKPIKPRGIRISSGTPKGYYAEDLADAWTRYCPRPLPGPQHPPQLPHRRSEGVKLWRIAPQPSATRPRKPPHHSSPWPADQPRRAGAATCRCGGTYPPQNRYPPQTQAADLQCCGVADVADPPERRKTDRSGVQPKPVGGGATRGRRPCSAMDGQELGTGLRPRGRSHSPRGTGRSGAED